MSDNAGPSTVARSSVLKAVAWCVGGAVVCGVSLLLAGPSAQLYLRIAGTWSPSHLADVVIIVLALTLALIGAWNYRNATSTRIATTLLGGLGVGIAYGASELFKLLYAQERPCHTILPDPSCPPVGSWSFPSNHATIAFALATAIVLSMASRWGYIAYALALASASSRVLDGVHYPHDVLAGAALGTCITVVITMFSPRVGDFLKGLVRRSDR